MASRHNIQAQEQFLHLENYRSEWDKPSELEIFPEEVKAEIVEVLEADQPNLKSYPWVIEPLASDEL